MTMTKAVGNKVFLVVLVLTVSISILFYSTPYTFRRNNVVIENGIKSCQSGKGNSYRKTLFFDRIYVINIERRTDRRERMTKMLNQLNLDYKFVSAIDSSSSEVDVYYKQHNGYLTRGAIACWLSHLKVYQSIFDDRSWEMLYIGHCSEENLRDPYKHPNLYVSTRPSCTHAYAISFIGAWVLLNELSNIKEPIDVELVRLIEPGKINSFSIEPPLAAQWRDGNPSDVSANDTSYIPYYLKRSTLRYLRIVE
ncbi:17686_t:CDS:2 [Funneliformis caledonium]|uniref:17686_t:CDS:1 n=1 Tax=Funneliformis caledonium TaxID=1117310 RepID=A0A9N9CRF1_9GLOM|nr:17686_t:CDS:2 [Funneliformis caledonium]